MKMEKTRNLRGLLCSARFWLGLLLAVLIAFDIKTIFAFSQMEALASNGLSKDVAAAIQKWTEGRFEIQPSDSFWRYDLNNIVRKMGHVLEFSLLGMAICGFLNILTRRNWLAILVSPLICFGVACADEYIQQFSQGRGPSWRDVRLDTFSAVIGVLLVGIVFGLFWYVHGLKRRIHLVENLKTENNNENE